MGALRGKMALLDTRVHYRRRCQYNTANNQVRVVRTPGGKLVTQHRKKWGNYAVCKDTGNRLQGIKRSRKSERNAMKSHDKTVSRPYGGAMSANAVKERILRAFLLEEQKCVMSLVAAKAQIDKKKSQTKKR